MYRRSLKSLLLGSTLASLFLSTFAPLAMAQSMFGQSMSYGGYSPSMGMGMSPGFSGMSGYNTASYSMPIGAGVMMSSMNGSNMGQMNPYLGGTMAGMGSFQGGSMGAPSTAMMGMGMMGGLAQQTVGTALQMQQNMVMATYQAQMNKPSLPLVKQDGFFPECQIMPAENSHPSLNSCAPGSITDPYSQLQTQQLQIRAEHMAKNYEIAVMGGQQLGTNMGLQCVKEKSQKLYDQLARNRQQLDNEISKLNEANTKVKNEMQNALVKMKQIKSDLQGGSSTLQDQQRDFRKIFDSEACRDVMDLGALPSGQGLYSIRDTLKSNQQKAARINRDIQSNRLEKMIENDLKKMNEQDDTGVAAATGVNFAIVQTTYTRELSVAQAKYAQVVRRITAAIPEAKEQLPESLKELELSRVKDDLMSKDYYKKLIKGRCLQTSSKTITYSQIVERMQQIDSNGGVIPAAQSVSLQNFKEDLSKVFSQTDLTMEEMIAQVKAIEAQHAGQSFRAQVGTLYKKDGRNLFWKPSEILNSSNQYCEDEYKYKPYKDGSKKSWSDVVNQEVSDLETFRGGMDKKQSQIAEIVRNRVLNCEGIPVPSTPEDCTQQLNLASENFCAVHATQCSKSLESCMQRADAAVKGKEVELEKKSVQYNDMVTSVIKQQNERLKQVANSVSAVGATLNSYFPGGQFKLEFGGGGGQGASNGMFIGLPAKGRDAGGLGVSLLGDGSTQFIDDIAQKLAQLKQSLQTQENNIKATVDRRLEEVKAQYEKEKQFWTSLATKCQGANQQYAQQMSSNYQQQAMMYNQQRQAFADFCNRLQYAMVGPGCNGDLQFLTQKLSAASAFMPGGMGPEMAKLNEFGRLCNNYQLSMQNDIGLTDPLFQNSNNPQGINLVDLCVRNGGNTRAIYNNFSSTLSTTAWQVSSILNSRFGTKIANTDIAAIIQNTAEQNQAAGPNDPLTLVGLPLNSAQLEGTAAGKYLVNLIRLSILSQKKDYPKPAGGKDYCEYIRERSRDILKTINEGTPDSVPQLYKRCVSTSGATATPTAGGVPMMTQDPTFLQNCVNSSLDMEMKTQTDNPLGPLLENISKDMSRLKMEAATSTSGRMGEAPSPNCAGQHMMPPPATPVNGMPGSYTQSHFNAVSSGFSRGF